MNKEDLEVSSQNNKLLALVEHPVWAVFVQIVDEDMEALDTISSLYMENRSEGDLLREVQVRYHTISKVRDYIASAIEKAEDVVKELEESKSDIINITEPHHL